MSFLKKFFTSLLVALTCSVSAQVPPIVNHPMGDDGFANVPLQFSFPYYNQSFNNSWMYDNGVVSFLQPGTPGALNPGQWSGQPFNQINNKYFIAPLWADIAPISSTTYTTQGDATYQKYTWTNIAEYYSRGASPRLNTFSLTVRPDGSINTTYNQVNIQTSNLSVGTVGDPTKGEYNQIGFWNYGTQVDTSVLQNWNIAGTGNLCATDPLSNPSCPGYAEAYKTQQCTINSLYDPSCPGYQQAYFSQQCSINALYDPACPGYQQAYFNQQCTLNSLYNQSCPGYQQAYFSQQCTINPLYNAQCPGYGIAYAKQMAEKNASIQQETTTTESPIAIATNTNTSTATNSTTGTTTQVLPGGIVVDSTSTTAAVSLDAGGATISTTGTVAPSTGIPEVVATPTTVTSTPSVAAAATTTTTSTTAAVRPLVGPAPTALAIARQALNESQRVALSVADSSSKLSQALDAENVLEVTGINPILGTRQNSSTNDLKDENKEKEFVGIQQTTRNNNSSQENLTSQTVQNTESMKTETTETVNKNSKNNELAGTVTIASLGNAPQGFNSYTNFMIRDNVFYKPHEVYKNQQTVDNKYVSRRLFGATDQLHNKMVQSQYELGK